ncbi:RNA polymerase sigma-54 factor [Phycisphaerae bacterium RAS1]|nr:RNA polymerase sigma-54 factor [Phycisphaerae bacterium RAS1]
MLSQIPRQLLQQQQRLTPQLIQAMDILQLPIMALESRIAAELDSNPALELAAGDDDNMSVTATEPESPVETPARTEDERALVVDENAGPREFERLDNLVNEYEFLDDDFEYRGTKSRAKGMEESEGKLEAMSNAAARPVSLEEHLLSQWSLVEIDERTRRIGEAIIGEIDDNGRFELRPEMTFDQQPAPTPDEIDAVLRRVQQLDPPGIAARSLQECVLLQLAALPGDNELVIRLIRKHFEDLQKNRLPQIARSLGVDVEDVKAAVHVISKLSLHPGADVNGRASPPIVPDIVVEYDADADQYRTRLTRGNFRELRISDEFREALERSRDDKSTREFIKQKIEAASAIIDAVRFRRERLLDVAVAVVEAQREFLDKGEQHLKVLRMSELADRFQCDPSTISRTVDEKYMQTPRGIFPLRRFFTGGTESVTGETLGWDSIKAKVQEIVGAEDKRAPLSDDEIVDILARQGLDIKRRTVAKYRAQLDIPTARQRKQF